MEQEERLELNTSVELYLLVVMICICAVALWEGGKRCVRAEGGVRMAAMKAKEKILTKAELKELRELLSCEPEDMTTEEHERFVLLAALAGLEPESDVPVPRPKRRPKAKAKAKATAMEGTTRVEMTSSATSSTGIPMTAPFSAGIPPGGGETRATFGSQGISIPEDFKKVLKDVGTQVVLDAAPCPDEVWLTPNGNCVHPKKTCPTLAVSSRRERRTVCQVCWPGKPMISLEEWNSRKGR